MTIATIIVLAVGLLLILISFLLTGKGEPEEEAVEEKTTPGLREDLTDADKKQLKKLTDNYIREYGKKQVKDLTRSSIDAEVKSATAAKQPEIEQKLADKLGAIDQKMAKVDQKLAEIDARSEAGVKAVSNQASAISAGWAQNRQEVQTVYEQIADKEKELKLQLGLIDEYKKGLEKLKEDADLSVNRLQELQQVEMAGRFVPAAAEAVAEAPAEAVEEVKEAAVQDLKEAEETLQDTTDVAEATVEDVVEETEEAVEEAVEETEEAAAEATGEVEEAAGDIEEEIEDTEEVVEEAAEDAEEMAETSVEEDEEAAEEEEDEEDSDDSEEDEDEEDVEDAVEDSAEDEDEADDESYDEDENEADDESYDEDEDEADDESYDEDEDEADDESYDEDEDEADDESYDEDEAVASNIVAFPQEVDQEAIEDATRETLGRVDQQVEEDESLGESDEFDDDEFDDEFDEDDDDLQSITNLDQILDREGIDLSAEDPTINILTMYGAGLSIIEISKVLKMGVGEVKYIIDSNSRNQ